jgi:hypothetical protein
VRGEKATPGQETYSSNANRDPLDPKMVGRSLLSRAVRVASRANLARPIEDEFEFEIEYDLGSG